MEQISDKTTGSLYERILEIINDPMDILKIKTNKQAKSIEKIILEEKIKLLNDLWKRHLTNNKLLGEKFSTYITELQNQLSELK